MRNTPELMPFAATASTIVLQRARRDARYIAIRETAIDQIATRCAASTTADLRAAGGRSAIGRSEADAVISARVADADAMVGSPMFPYTVGDVVRLDLVDILRAAYAREFEIRARG